MSKVLIVGGGLAGCAAACELAESGIGVTLVERRRQLGGRLSAFDHGPTGERVASPHLMVRAYEETLGLLTRIGVADRIDFQDRLTLPLCDLRSDARIQQRRFAAARWPAPWHLAGGLARIEGLSFADRARALAVAAAVRGRGTPPEDELTAAAWLARCGQSAELQAVLWEPLGVAALNQSLEVASAAMLAAVLRQVFAGDPGSACIGFAREPLADLLDRGCREYLSARGVTLRMQTSLDALRFVGDRVCGAQVRDEQLDCDLAILAVQPQALRGLLPERLHRLPFLAALDGLGSSPIVSIHLWLDRPVMQERLLGLIGSPLGWILNRASKPEGPFLLSVVASAAQTLVGKEAPALIELALAGVRQALPAAREATLVAGQVMRYPDATISHAAGSARFRPGARTPVANLLLAGDYVATGLPATIEGAVRSGRDAARLARGMLGR